MKKAKTCSQTLSQRVKALDLALVLYCALLLKEHLYVPSESGP